MPSRKRIRKQFQSILFDQITDGHVNSNRFLFRTRTVRKRNCMNHSNYVNTDRKSSFPSRESDPNHDQQKMLETIKVIYIRFQEIYIPCIPCKNYSFTSNQIFCFSHCSIRFIGIPKRTEIYHKQKATKKSIFSTSTKQSKQQHLNHGFELRRVKV